MNAKKKDFSKPEDIKNFDFGTDFDDLEGDLNADTVKPSNPLKAKKQYGREETDRAEQLFSEKCEKCNGTGRYQGFSSRGIQCFACNGKGVRLFKTPKAQREKARDAAAARKERIASENLTNFESRHPRVAAWWTGSDFGFAVSLREAAIKFGDLTENQLGAAYRCIEKFEAAKKAREDRLADAKVVNVTSIAASMNKAKASGLKRISMTLLGNDAKVTIKFASDYGVNAGALYVYHEDAYAGKIPAGDSRFIKGRDCTPEMETDIIAALANPEEQAIAYGKRFGICSCCGRQLTNQLSIDLGIGPICRAKFF